MLVNLTKDMLSNWSAVRDIVLTVKAKMMEMDGQLINLDDTITWKCMAGTAGQVGHVDGRSGSRTSGRPRDACSVLAPRLA